MPQHRSVRILESFWPNKRDVDPIALETAGDWTMLQNLYSGLVELSEPQAVRPALAERWERNAEGTLWTFWLKPNLRWSDGSSITTEEVVASLKRAHRGTAHSDLSKYVKDIRAVDTSRIEFELSSTPQNFLVTLAFADSSIVHPAAYKSGGFTWDAPVSGAFRIKSFSKDKVDLMANEHYWDRHVNDVGNATLYHAEGDMRDVESLMHGDWDASQLSPGVIDETIDLERLKSKYDVFSGGADFTFALTFSKNPIRAQKLSENDRKYLFYEFYSRFWGKEPQSSLRATGLRPPGTLGAMGHAEYQELIRDFKSLVPTKIPLSLEVVVGVRFENRAVVKRSLAILKDMGIQVKVTVARGQDFMQKLKSGNFDLMVNFLGASEADPDSAWRIYNDVAFSEKVASDEELLEAQMEPSKARRDILYKEFERRVISRALMIPIKNEVTYIFASSRVQLDPKLAADWGLQLPKLRFR